MRELTLERFLYNYVKELSHKNTLDILKLEKETKKNVRLEQVLPLLLLVNEKKREVLEKKHPNSISLENMIHITNLKDSFNLYDFLVSDLAKIEYKKVLEAYKFEKNKKNTEFDRKDLYLKKIKELRKKKIISDYKIYKSLNINSGNFHSFYHSNELNKLSLIKVRDLYNFIESY